MYDARTRIQVRLLWYGVGWRKLALDCGKAIPTKRRVPKESKAEELPESSPALEQQDGGEVKIAEIEVSETPSIKPKRGRKPKQAPVVV